MGEIMVVVPTTQLHGWRYVVDFQTGLIGWVKAGRLHIVRTAAKQPLLTFVRHATPDANAPQVALKNGSGTLVRLRLDDKWFVVPGGAQTTISVSPGDYSYIISVAKCIPQFGTRKFDAGFNYTWSLNENSEPVLAPTPASAH